MDREAFLEKVLEHYTGCYDIVRAEEAKMPLAATAEYHEHNVGYMLSRKAEMWSADRHEYVWFWSIPVLTEEVYTALYAQTLEAGTKRVDPDSGHMCSNIVAVFLCDRADEAALTALSRAKGRKMFMLGLKGWMEVHTAAAVMETSEVHGNRDARNEKTFLNSIFRPVRKRSSILKKISAVCSD